MLTRLIWIVTLLVVWSAPAAAELRHSGNVTGVVVGTSRADLTLQDGLFVRV